MAVRPVLDKNGEQLIDPKRKLPVWFIDVYPAGGKGRRIQFRFSAKEGAANYLFVKLRAGDNYRKLPVDCKVLDLFALWLKYYKNNRSPRTYADAVGCLRVLVPFFSDYRVDALSQEIIEEYKEKRLLDENLRRPGQKVKKRTIAKELSYFGSMLSWAYDFKHVSTHFKFRSFPKKKAPRRNILTPEELHLLIENIEEKYRLAVLLMSDTGMRMNEALKLRAGNVDITNEVIQIRGKGDKERIVPIMTERLRSALITKMADIRKKQKRWPKYKDFLVMNPKTRKPYWDIKKPLERARVAAGIEKHINHHLLRHTFGTQACVSGMSLSAIQQIMGHADIKTTEGYLHLAAEILKLEGRKFGARMEITKNRVETPVPVIGSGGKVADNIIEFRPRR